MSGSASQSWRTTASRSGPIGNDRAPVPETSPPVETALLQLRPGRGEAGHTPVPSGIVAPGLPLSRSGHTAVPSGIVARGRGAHAAEQDELRHQLGLKDQTATAQLASDMHGLQGSWSAMTPAERADEVGHRINARLHDIGVPELKIKAVEIPGNAHGSFEFLEWAIDINRGTLRAPQLDVNQLGSLTNTVYHEARHAEQWYLMARFAAERGTSPATLSKETRIPLRVCEAAAIAPPLSRAQAEAAAVFYGSVYGDRSSHRHQVFKERRRIKQLLAAGPTLAAIEADPNLSAAEKQQRTHDARQLQEQNYQYFQAYKDLPEEKDAWEVGTAAEQAFHATQLDRYGTLDLPAGSRLRHWIDAVLHLRTSRAH